MNKNIYIIVMALVLILAGYFGLEQPLNITADTGAPVSFSASYNTGTGLLSLSGTYNWVNGCQGEHRRVGFAIFTNGATPANPGTGSLDGINTNTIHVVDSNSCTPSGSWSDFHTLNSAPSSVCVLIYDVHIQNWNSTSGHNRIPAGSNRNTDNSFDANGGNYPSGSCGQLVVITPTPTPTTTPSTSSGPTATPTSTPTPSSTSSPSPTPTQTPTPTTTPTPEPTPTPSTSSEPTATPTPTPPPTCNNCGGGGGGIVPVVYLEKFGRNITQNETEPKSSVSSKPGDIIEFTIKVSAYNFLGLSNVKLKDIIPSQLSYINGSTKVNDTGVNDDIISSQGLNLGSIDFGSPKTVKLLTTVKETNQFSTAVTNLENIAQATSDTGSREAKLPITVQVSEVLGTSTIAEVVGIKTGVNYLLFSLILALIISNGYNFYTHRKN